MKFLQSIIVFILSINIAYALPSGFVFLNDVDGSILQDMRYAGYHNFIGRPIKGYQAKACILTKQTAHALSVVQRELSKLSLSLKVYDCYRPTMAVADFMIWSKDLTHQEMKQEFYPRINKADVFNLGYVAEKSGHSRGSTVDLTIVPIPSPIQAGYKPGQKLVSCIAPYHRRFQDNSIDMGTGFDCLDELASVSNININSQAYKNRMLLQQIMIENGFQPYLKEWWHFTLNNEPFPETYFNFVVRQNASTSTLSNSQSEKISFLTLSDIHFDPFISCDKAKLCPLIQKLRSSSSTQWPKIFAQFDVTPPQLRKDTNFSLLNSSLAASRQAADLSQAKFVLLLGDSLGHEYHAKYKQYSGDRTVTGFQSFARKTLEFLTEQLAATFPNIDVYTIVGNNDSYQGDYVTYPEGQFFKDAARLWSGLIKNSFNRSTMQNQFRKSGYYSIVLPNSGNLRIIVLNSNLFSYKAKVSDLDKRAIEQLNWLHEQLQKAKSIHQTVFIAMHIPQGIDVYATLRTRLFRLITLWKPQYIQRFQSEISQFSPEIAGVFTGHLHSDKLQMMTFGANEIPLIGVTSISPIFGNNPGFKICAYSTNTMHLDDFVTYSYSINGKNAWSVESHLKM